MVAERATTGCKCATRGPIMRAMARIALAFLLVCVGGATAEARVGVVLNESLDTSLARITGAGHTAVYFSRICPASPVKLRLCRPGEEGSVISNYTTLGEDSPYEWNVVPLSIYLYGVENPANRPLVGSEKIKNALEERYREKYLGEYCQDQSCRTSKDAEWREMVAATLERSLYIFSVDTTLEQDKKFIEMFNAEPNVNHFNGVTRNCATFTARILNWYYPHSVTPEYLNDFGMSSPKAMARSLTHYALKHPELQFDIAHFAQAPGTIKRSSECRDGTEQLYHSKKLLVPMLIFADHELAAAAATYWLTGRFNPVHEAEWYPNVEASQRAADLQVAERDNEGAMVKELREEARGERELIYGTSQEWRRYREDLASEEDETVAEEWVGKIADLNRTIQRLNRDGRVKVEPDGSLWLEIANDNERMRVGISSSNVLAPGSDARLAYEMLLDRDERVVKSPPHSRESMREFRADWQVLQEARKRNLTSFAREEEAGSAGQTDAAAIPESGAGN